MASLGTFDQQPLDKVDYDVSYADWIEDTSGDTVVSATATSSDPAFNIDLVTVRTDDTVKVWVSGGVLGGTYIVTIVATTREGRVKQDEFKVKVKQ